MAINTTMGIKSIKYGTAGTSMPTQLTAVGDVYQDSATFVENDPTITEHKSETSAKRIVIKRKEGFKLQFSIMDPTVTEIAAFCGGTATTTSGNTWTEAEGNPQIAMAIEVVPEQGLALKMPNCSVAAKINTTYSATGITLLDVTITPQSAISYGTASA